MVERSLQASPAGIQAAKTALISLGLNQQKLADRLGVTRQPISKFFNGKPVDRNLFVRICETLKLDWQEIAGRLQDDPEPDSEDDIDALVEAVREQIKPLIKERCGTMRVLDMTQPIALTGEQGIYTNVNILNKITGRRRLGIEGLQQRFNPEEFVPLNYSPNSKEEVTGLQAIQFHKKLLLLGKPGSGKTTFLKSLAMQYIESGFPEKKVPIFINLGDFANTGIDTFAQYISKYFSRVNITIEQLRELFQYGAVLVLLDSLDEVREQDSLRVVNAIREFADYYPNNQFVITCRLAAIDYVFESFTEVELADFNWKQISNFVQRWFYKNTTEKAKNCIKEIQQNNRIQELATNPLLLTLLCLVFDECGYLPKNRADLYREGVDVLLNQWDSTRNIKRDQPYQNLSNHHKQDLLSYIALSTFKEEKYLFRQEDAERYISTFMHSLNNVNSTAVTYIDSEAILRSIEVQHGLLAARAKRIYAFSHLTFHEYFASREIINHSDLSELTSYITQKRWKEVFLITMGMIKNPDDLILLMKQKIDSIIISDGQIVSFLEWIKQEANPSAIRIFHHHFIRVLSTRNLIKNLDSYLSIANDHVYELAHDLRQILKRIHETSFRLNLAINSNLDRINDSTLASSLNCDLSLAISHIYNISLHPKLYFSLKKLQLGLPDSSYQNWKNFQTWWQTNHENWINTLETARSEFNELEIGWSFTSRQKELLQQYYDANKLLVDCLNSDCYISREVRQEIEDTLLLPIAEIEKYKAANNS